MKIGKVELTRERLVIALAAAITVIALGIYLIFFVPIMGKLGMKYLECKSVENEVFETRNIIESAGKIYGRRLLMTEKDLPRAIDELTKHGTLKDIDFISINPKEVKKEKGSQYKIMPIEIEIESTYEELGKFLGSLDELEKGLVKVKGFEVVPDKKNPSKFITDLTVDIYLSGRE